MLVAFWYDRGRMVNMDVERCNVEPWLNQLWRPSVKAPGMACKLYSRALSSTPCGWIPLYSLYTLYFAAITVPELRRQKED